MKKLLLLFFSITVLAACSSDDDAPAEGPDPILGTWELVDATAFEVDDCPERSVVTFNTGNTGSGTFYFPQGGCTPQVSSGSWQNLGNSRYSLAVPILGNLEGDVTFTGNDTFVFDTDGAGTFTFEKQ